MAKPKNEVTSARVASIAARILANPNSTAAQKSAAASALTQRPGAGGQPGPRKK